MICITGLRDNTSMPQLALISTAYFKLSDLKIACKIDTIIIQYFYTYIHTTQPHGTDSMVRHPPYTPTLKFSCQISIIITL